MTDAEPRVPTAGRSHGKQSRPGRFQPGLHLATTPYAKQDLSRGPWGCGKSKQAGDRGPVTRACTSREPANRGRNRQPSEFVSDGRISLLAGESPCLGPQDLLLVWGSGEGINWELKAFGWRDGCSHCAVASAPRSPMPSGQCPLPSSLALTNFRRRFSGDGDGGALGGRTGRPALHNSSTRW